MRFSAIELKISGTTFRVLLATPLETPYKDGISVDVAKNSGAHSIIVREVRGVPETRTRNFANVGFFNVLLAAISAISSIFFELFSVT